jgi:hypothetical protein
MTISLGQLKSLVQAEGLAFFEDPRRPAILLNFTGANGTYMVVMIVELDGRFMQFRTLGYGSCPATHQNLLALLRVLGEMDYRYRLTKFGWDPADGEIVGYADLWLEDGTLTQGQLAAMLRAFLPAIDQARPRIARTIETGIDPDGTAAGGAGIPAKPPTRDPVSV